MSDFLNIKDLVVEYTSGGAVVQAVNGVDISIEKGHTLGLVGETGAGKTTIAKAILRILPDPPGGQKADRHADHHRNYGHRPPAAV